jgi:hypothetical protein
MKNNGKPEVTNYQVALRLMGHKLLLSGDDRKSRVMPVKELPDDEFQIHFESQLSLEPDSIFTIITETAKSSSLPDKYTVNVLSCSNNEIVYSFVMSAIDSNIMVPCLGRTLPRGCYYIAINFSPSRPDTSINGYIILAGVLLLTLLAYLVYLFRRKKKNTVLKLQENLLAGETIQVGEFLFHFDQRCIEIKGERIDLTDKESKLLYILASAQKKVVNREQLQKEVWENEGVIVTRSLDVFISKLRKKLEKDPRIRITNVHGKGYKLDHF